MRLIDADAIRVKPEYMENICGIAMIRAEDLARILIEQPTISGDQKLNPVKPVRDEKTGRIWLCGNCGSYVGFEDHDESDPNEFDNFCRECGHPVSWEGRQSK